MPIQRAKWLGWRPDLPDARDLTYAAPLSKAAPLPPIMSLRDKMPPVYDQGALGSCTSNAIGAAVQYARRHQNLLPDFVPSRLFIYYCERLIERTVYYDAGAMIRDGMRVVAKQGSPPETDWPYDISKFAVRPPKLAYLDALNNQVLQYSRVTQSLSQMKGCLAAGFPFVLGFAVYASFMTDEVATTGIMPMPASNEDMLGGHAVLAVGYDDVRHTFLIRNSWGPDWGQAGYFEMPYAYLIDRQLSSDLWMVRLVES